MKQTLFFNQTNENHLLKIFWLKQVFFLATTTSGYNKHIFFYPNEVVIIDIECYLLFWKHSGKYTNEKVKTFEHTKLGYDGLGLVCLCLVRLGLVCLFSQEI